MHSGDELRRRRLLGGIAVAALLLIALALNGWHLRPIWTVFEDREGTFAAGDPYNEWVYAVCDGDEQQVTVLRDGHLEGAQALDSLRSVRFPNWCSSLPTVDNPELAQWQSQLSDLQALTANAASADPILDAAERMPVSTFYLKPIADWIRDETHALSFLDTLADRPMQLGHSNPAIRRARRDDFADLIGNALDVATRSDVTPRQVERWLASDQIAGSGEALLRLARVDGLSDTARFAVLQRLDTVRPDQRTDVYLSVASKLVRAPEYAGPLQQQLRQLPGRDRSTAAQQLLARPDSSIEFSTAVLSSLGRHHPDSQMQLFTAIAENLKHQPDAPLILARRLKDLNVMQRRPAANYLLGLDGPGETAFALSVLGAFADLHPRSQSRFIYTLLQSPQFEDRSVQEACLLAIQLQVRGPTRAELLGAMLSHPRLDAGLRARVGAEIGAASLGETA